MPAVVDTVVAPLLRQHRVGGAPARQLRDEQFVSEAVTGGTQGRRVRGSNNGDVNVLCKMMDDTVQSIYPKCAHRARAPLLLSEHEVVDHQRPVSGGE